MKKLNKINEARYRLQESSVFDFGESVYFLSQATDVLWSLAHKRLLFRCYFVCRGSLINL